MPLSLHVHGVVTGSTKGTSLSAFSTWSGFRGVGSGPGWGVEGQGCRVSAIRPDVALQAED